MSGASTTPLWSRPLAERFQALCSGANSQFSAGCARLGSVRQTVQIDFGVGDAVHPEPQVIDYPVLLTSTPVRLSAYPVEAAIAEKFEAMVHLDLQNSRMKDFYDIWILSRTLTFSGPALSQAIRSTFDRRQTSVPVIPPAGLTAKFHSEPLSCPPMDGVCT